MKTGDKVRWAEAHCRLESWKAKPHQALALYDMLRKEEGEFVRRQQIGDREVLHIRMGSEVHVLPAELLERVEP